jgi:hypothetical protein
MFWSLLLALFIKAEGFESSWSGQYIGTPLSPTCKYSNSEKFLHEPSASVNIFELLSMPLE